MLPLIPLSKSYSGPTPFNTKSKKSQLVDRLLSFSAQKRKQHSDPCRRSSSNDEEEQQILRKDDETDVQRECDSFSASEIDDCREQEKSSLRSDDSVHDVCDTIDDLMHGLHSCIESDGKDRATFKVEKDDTCFDYDWVLDGTDSEAEDELDNSKTRRRRKFGDAALDEMLGMLEIENASYTTSGSSLDGENSTPGSNINDAKADVDENEEVIEFADFSQFEPENGEICHEANIVNLRMGPVPASELVLQNNLQNDILYEYERNDTSEEISQSAEATTADEEPKTPGNIIWSSPEYKPPSSIECLVSDLDAELDVTIEKCLALDMTSIESEGSSSHEDDCADVLEEPDLAPHTGAQKQKNEHKQSLLMSSLLLESLPVPIPSSSSDDPAVSFTRRIQINHTALEFHENDEAKSINAIQREDNLLEGKLADTIHPGYYCSIGEDCDSSYFDSIVLEEVLSVPWPFYEIDLKEPFFDEENDPDDSERIDHLSFDSYISNRLSELDLATGEIMSCILSRVSQKEDAINEGVEKVFSAELDIITALVFTKSSREFLHRAKHGYPLDCDRLDGNMNAPTNLHNAVSGGLKYLHYADSRDKLRYLLETIDQISSICDLEAQWWEDARIIAPHRFQKLVDDTNRLTGLVRGEEVLNHAIGLSAMRERLHNLPEALLGRVEASLADLFARILHSGKSSTSAFDGYFLEYETLLNSWLSCCHDKNATNQSEATHLAAEWSGCILKILCFEASKASACSLIDSYYDERTKSPDSTKHGALDEFNSQLSQMKDEAGLESLSHKLLVMQLGGGHQISVLSSTFFHLCSRLVELMNVYNVALQWHKTIIDRTNSVHEPISNLSDVASKTKIGRDKFESKRTTVSSMSSERELHVSLDEASVNDEPGSDTSKRPVPENLEFKRNVTPNLDESMYKSMELISRALWKQCEVALINLIEFYMSQGEDLEVHSGDSTDFATGNLRLIYDIILQFAFFSSCFLDEEDGVEEDCGTLENELSKLTRRHLRSVHIEAMKTTGILLRHEAWQLAPLELARTFFKAVTNGMNCRHDGSRSTRTDSNAATMRAIYDAVGDLLLGAALNGQKSEHQFLITARSEDRGYRYCHSFAHFLEKTPPSHSPASIEERLQHLQGCFGICSMEFSSAILPFVEIQPCGKLALSILTQSSAGLAKWTARLLNIGNTLPLVAEDAFAAVMTLFDLYILTVFRLCARSKVNEDVLIGFGRGTASHSGSSSSVSLTTEADAVSPLPREGADFVETQEFIRRSRKRLENIVNLDKFESSNDDMGPTSPRSKDGSFNCARRLEKEAAAACSCFFAAVLVDVASKVFYTGQDRSSQRHPLWADLKDATTCLENNEDERSTEKEDSLELYSKAAIAIVPNLVTQATRFAAVNSISGKELIFQIICCGRVWEGQNMHEHSNSYADDACERSAILWGYMSSSMRLPPPALQYTWDQLVRVAFLLFLEGFSKVPNCSTEGRSLMSMDLASLFHGLIPETVHAELLDDYPTISPPPHACRDEMMRHVDTFIKVFYFPYQDILDWIKDNSGDYHLDHSLSLITSKSAGSKDKKNIASGKKSVVEIYNQRKSTLGDDCIY